MVALIAPRHPAARRRRAAEAAARRERLAAVERPRIEAAPAPSRPSSLEVVGGRIVVMGRGAAPRTDVNGRR
jgi:hypothetical protein